MQKWLKVISILVFAVAAYFTLFKGLGDKTLQLWDEARLANNTLEMLENGNIWVTYYNGEPDMWNTKPPFLIWVQSISASIFGVNVWALRLPSAIAGLLTALVLWLFCARVLKKWWMGFFSAMALITYPYFVVEHVTRSADYDAMLILFTTIYVLAFYIYTQTKQTKYLYYTAIGVTLAILTKSIAGVILVPFMGLWLLANKELVNLLKSKHFYFSLAIILVLGVGYYFLREALNPGYLQAVSENDLGGRFNTAIEGHRGEWWFYLAGLYFYVILITGPALLGLIMLIVNNKKLASYLLLLISGAVLVLSIAETKILWYLAVIYPFLMLGFGYLAYALINTKWVVVKLMGVLASLVLICYMGLLTYGDENYYGPQGDIGYENYIKSLPEYKSYNLVSNMPYNGHMNFYIKLFNKKGYNLKHFKRSDLKIGDTVMMCEREAMRKVREKFDYQVLDSGTSCIMVKISDKVSDSTTTNADTTTLISNNH